MLEVEKRGEGRVCNYPPKKMIGYKILKIEKKEREFSAEEAGVQAYIVSTLYEYNIHVRPSDVALHYNAVV